MRAPRCKTIRWAHCQRSVQGSVSSFGRLVYDSDFDEYAVEIFCILKFSEITSVFRNAFYRFNTWFSNRPLFQVPDEQVVFQNDVRITFLDPDA